MIVNKKIALAMFFIFAVGLCSGAFFEIYMKGEGKTQLMDMHFRGWFPAAPDKALFPHFGIVSERG